MPIISVLNQKGGCGKTTISINVAHSFKRSGYNVLLVDADPQASSRDWNNVNDGDLVDVARMDTANLPKDLSLIGGYDWIIIDGAPRLEPLIKAAVSVSDMVLIPIQPSALDIWACIDLVNLVLKTQKQCKGDPKAAFIVSRKISNAKTTKATKKALKRQSIPAMINGTTQRVIYASSIGDGETVFTASQTNQAAIDEISKIKDELIGRLVPDSPQAIELSAQLEKIEEEEKELVDGA